MKTLQRHLETVSPRVRPARFLKVPRLDDPLLRAELWECEGEHHKAVGIGLQFRWGFEDPQKVLQVGQPRVAGRVLGVVRLNACDNPRGAFFTLCAGTIGLPFSVNGLWPGGLSN